MKTGFFDTETTGLLVPSLSPIDKQPYVFEFYLVDEEDFADHVWIKPPISIPKESSKITGIYDKDVASYEPFGAHADKIRSSIEQLDVLYAHNMSYDFAVINYEFARIGQTINWPEIKCTVELTEWLMGYRLNLQALHEYLFGEGFEGAHGAVVDVGALKKCVLELMARGLV